MNDTPNDSAYEVRDRRPMKPREWGVMQRLTGVLVRLGLSANAISVLSVACASLGGAALVFTTQTHGWAQRGLWLAGGLFVELRALCNLLDGMVAVRTGTASATGELYNEVPDRLSDLAMLAGLGYAAAAPELGWAAAAAAVLVAYVRAQAAAAGAGQDYGGPMAKPVRMQLVAVFCVVVAAIGPANLPHYSGEIVLWLVVVGCAVTVAFRLRRAANRLRGEAAS